MIHAHPLVGSGGAGSRVDGKSRNKKPTGIVSNVFIDRLNCDLRALRVTESLPSA